MLTLDQVRQAVSVLEAEGEVVTMRTVRAKLGGYSMRDISKFYKQLRQTTLEQGPGQANGTHAALPPQPLSLVSAPPTAPTPAPEPQDERARLEHYLGLARRRKVALEEEMTELRVRAGQFMPMHEVREFNRKIVGTERAIEAAQRDIGQYLGEISRLRS
jgi:Plasmid replication region DNA-binding N-term